MKKSNILMYHAVGASQNSEAGAKLYSVPVSNFEHQMEYIAKVTSSGLANAGDNPLITFDDGDITNYKHAFPILQLLGLKAYFFIIVSKVGGTGYMTWHQIRELKNAGMIIGSHGMTHRILTTLKPEELEFELKESKNILEEKLHGEIEYFSIPRGFYNQKIIRMAKESGYKNIFTSDDRIAVKANWDTDYFIRVVNKGLSLRDKSKELLKSSAKKVLGAKGYDKVRSGILKGSPHHKVTTSPV